MSLSERSLDDVVALRVFAEHPVAESAAKRAVRERTDEAPYHGTPRRDRLGPTILGNGSACFNFFPPRRRLGIFLGWIRPCHAKRF